MDLADFRLDLFFNVEWVPAFIGCFSFQVGLHSFVVILPVVFETVILSQGTRNCLAVILDWKVQGTRFIIALLWLLDDSLLQKSIHLLSEGVVEGIFLFLLFLFAHFQLNSLAFGSYFATKLFSCLFYSFQRVSILNLLFFFSKLMLSTKFIKTLRQIECNFFLSV